ncbi:helix-turn-helix domain-containing protein [Psychrobacillus sp. NPDC096426]|uniref:helix-turn-helix domain-containing protein n=1 Tax=Psychrobacillus sp. NPDC096426 TaxID=3364491 RepID=UPI0037F78693
MVELLEVSEIAKLLKCNKVFVYKLIKSGQLVGLKLGRMKVSSIELEDFMKRNAGKDLTDPFNVKVLEITKREEK